jgi:hypothetical protein
MARTTEAAVRLAIDTDLTSDQVLAFIDDASTFVDDIASADTTISSAKLTLIEKYLAAHFVTLRDPRLKASKIGDTSDTFQRDDEVSEYLKAAIALDPTGTIDDAFDDERNKFRFRVGTGYA